jgi:hypothetical protein
LGRSQSEVAFAAAPIRLVALRTDVPDKLARGRVAAQGTFHGGAFFRGSHFFTSLAEAGWRVHLPASPFHDLKINGNFPSTPFSHTAVFQKTEEKHASPYY